MKLLCRLPWSSVREPPERPASLRSHSTGTTILVPETAVQKQTSHLGLTALSTPDDPDIDLVFVHGLGGNSRKTWGTTDGQPACWPADWLPTEPGFERIRIQTFGYDTKFLKGPGNCLNVHHLGKLLLGELETSPTLGLSKTRIVFIAHSMGGLVVKKTFLLAKQDPAYHGLAERMTSIIFLACPHHGADSAKLLRRVLSPVYDRQYLADLERNSPTLQNINNEFRKHASELAIWSFYETQKMSLWSSLVVDEASAVLNYPEEKQRPMTADHRSICKFNSRDDPNYITIRNSICFIVNGLRTKSLEAISSTSADQSRAIRQLLGYNSPPDDTLDSLSEKRDPDTCDWILSNEMFNDWSSQSRHGNSILWISGKPGWGKSVLSSFVVEHLSKLGSKVHSYFFQFSDYRKSTFEDCLRSISYQLALSNDLCRESLLKMHADGIRLDGMLARPFWKTMMSSGSFKDIEGRQYLVLDGLDECGEPHVVLDTLVQILQEESVAEFRLLIIGREMPGLSSFGSIRPELFQHLTLEASHTSSALSKVISRRLPFIASIKSRDREEVAARILEQAQGSFLFADSVLRELSSCHDQTEVSRALETMPEGMEPVYRRVIESIAQSGTSKQLTHSILSWVICASRPLTVDELQAALEVELDTTFHNLWDSIVTLCGQLVSVDQIGRVRLQHETAKHFLLNQQDRPDFLFIEGECHGRIAKACLRSLGRRQLRRNLISGAALTGFDIYSLIDLPLHLSKATQLLKELAELVERFFKAHFLDWIQVAVKHRGATVLSTASEQLSIFCCQCQLQIGESRSLKHISQVATDLAQVSRKYGAAITADPSAIHATIPQFCPMNSALRKAIKPNQSFQVVGNLEPQWTGALSSLSLDYSAVEIIAKDMYLAISLRLGYIAVFDTADYRQFRRLEHGSEVNHIAFNEDGKLFASTGEDTTKVWSLPQGECIYEFCHRGIGSLGLEFDGDRLLAPRHDDASFSWDLDSGKPEGSLSGTTNNLPEEKFLRVAISVSSKLLVSRSNDAIVVDVDTGDFICSCATPSSRDKDRNATIMDISFNPKSGMLAVIREQEILIIDPRYNEVLKRCAFPAVLLATSCNGRFLAGMETRHGVSAIVKIFDFDTLRFLYRIDTGIDDVELLSFSKNDTHLVGVYGRQARHCLVWELPQDLGEDSTWLQTHAEEDATVLSSVPRMPGSCDLETVLAPPKEDFIICAKANGEVNMFDRQAASFRCMVYQASCPLISMSWWSDYRAVLCVGIDNTVTLRSLPQSEQPEKDATEAACIFQFQMESKDRIRDVFIAEKEARVLISHSGTTYVYSDRGQCLGTASFSADRDDRRFACLPEIPGKALCFCSRTGVQTFDISNWTGNPEDTAITRFIDWPWRKSVFAGFYWEHKLHFSPDHRKAFIQGEVAIGLKGPRGLIITLDLDCIVSKQDAYISPPVSPSHESEPSTPVSYSELYNVPIRQIVAVLEEDIILFIDKSMWLSSLNLQTAHSVSSSPGSDGFTITGSLRYNRHFFIPTEFFNGEEVELSCAMVGQDLALIRSGRPILVKGFLEVKKEVSFDSYVSSEVLSANAWG